MRTRIVVVAGAALALPLALAAPAIASPGNISQGYGLPASGTCANAATDAPQASIPGAPTGGWKVGWGSWLNGGKGGAACVRVLVYSTSTNTWVAQ